MTDKIVLKKYGNRRLYDTNKSKYVTLQEVALAIKEGHQIEVINAKTKEDVTGSILTQIILEEAKNKNLLLPEPLLHLIIRFGDNVLLDFFQSHLQQTIRTYLAHKVTAENQFKKWIEMGIDMSEMTQKSLSDLNPLKSVFEQFSDHSPKNDKK